MEENKKNTGLIIALIIFIILTLLLGGYIAYDKFLSNKSNGLSDEINEEINVGENEINDEFEQSNSEKISLAKENETYTKDKLIINFKGNKVPEGDDYYKYTADIKYDDKTIDNSFFNDKNNYRIWSENMASSFEIYKINNVYILNSMIARQCFSSEIMIFNTNGEVLKTFSVVDVSIEGNTITIIEASDNSNCMKSDTKTYKYNISDSSLIQINN